MSDLRVPVAGLVEGPFELDPEMSRYVAKVHRLIAGAKLVLFDPHYGIEAEATVVAARLPRLLVHVSALREAPRREIPVTLAIVVGKADKPEQAVRDVVAFGAERLILLHSERSIAKSDSPARAERFMRIAEQTARQCGRGRLPQLLGPLPLDQFLASKEERSLRLVCAFHQQSLPLLQYSERILAAPEGVCLLVGPEGGFSKQEVEACLTAGYLAVDLGPFVLRTEVAAGAVLAVTRALFQQT